MTHTLERTSGPAPVFLLLTCLLAGCRAPAPGDGAPDGAAAPEPAPESIVLARVDGRPLTLQSALDTYVASHGGGHDVLLTGEPALRELAARLVERELFYNEALALGIPEEEEILDAVEERRYGQAEIVFWRVEVEEKVEVSDEEVEAFYAKTDVALALTVMQTDSREEAEELREQVLAGGDFGELASRHSRHASRTFGGGLPYVRRGDLDPVLEEVVFALVEEGSTTEVVEATDGWMFARLEGRTTNPDRPEREQMIPRIRIILEDRREDELRAAVEERVRRNAGVEIEADPALWELVLGDAPGETVLARSDGETLPLQTLRDALDLEAIARATSEEVDPILLGMVDDWALKRAVRRAARESGLLEHEEVVRKTKDFARDAALGTLYREYVYADVTYTDEDVRAFYDANCETDFTRPTEIRMAYVVTASAEEAGELRSRVEAGEDLQELSRQLSIDPASHMSGGRAQWLRPGQILEEVEDVAFGLAAGEIGGPISTDVGFFVLQVYERKESAIVPFERARTAATRRLVIERQKAAYGVWVDRLKERALVEFDEGGIRQGAAWLVQQEEAKEAAEADEEELEMVGPVPAPPAGHGGARP
jgi:parvulin-like peptidyl-prolyl isomerase